MAIENTVSSDFFIRVRRLLRAFSIAAYQVWLRNDQNAQLGTKKGKVFISRSHQWPI